MLSGLQQGLELQPAVPGECHNYRLHCSSAFIRGFPTTGLPSSMDLPTGGVSAVVELLLPSSLGPYQHYDGLGVMVLCAGGI